jgi:copper chaperone CopZ
MKKRFMIEELCCANCAAKMEAEIRKLDGVQSANINFLTQKLTFSVIPR